MKSIQFSLTPAAGKQLMALALAQHTDILTAAREATLVIVAGTTNTYIARAVLDALGLPGFTGRHFFRGVLCGQPLPADLPDLEGDVIIRKGCWLRGKTVQEIAPELKAGDIILKGANAVDLKTGEAAVLIGHPTGGTLTGIWEAVVARRARVLVPVGVEKRVDGPISELCALCCDPAATGARLAQAPGKAYTEIDAIRDLSGACAHLIAAGGVCGCEGAAWFQCTGTTEQLDTLAGFVSRAKEENAFIL